MQPGTNLNAFIKTLATTALILVSAQTLTACLPILVASATVTAIDIATDRRTLGRNIDDNALEITLRNAISQDSVLEGAHISVTVFNGIVLLTGEASTDAQRRQATTLAEQRIRTLKVVNELQLAGKTSITSRANDSLITSKVKTKLLLSDRVNASTIKVVTEAGKVYLLGLVTRAEGEAAEGAAQSVGGVTHIVKVFQYVSIR